MKYLKLFLPAFLILSIFLISCDDNDHDINLPINLLDDTYNNIPVSVNTLNSYTFTVAANDFDYSTEANLSFNNDSVVVAITSTEVSAQNSYVKIFNSSNQEIFSESLNESKVFVNTELGNETPTKIKIELNNFSGKLTFVLAENKKK
ncbi:MAG: hypothetical protein KDC90_04610 [Ignavibacteriae bacterium]|nr:hypothetical protein [Ignavibacteriota bacterium]